MSLASKMSAGLLAAACVCSLAAAEIISITEPADFKTPKQVTQGENSLSVKGKGFYLFSAKTLTLDPEKKYKISGEFRLSEGEGGGNLYLGFAPYDANGKPIRAVSVNAAPKTDTVVAKAAAAGDTVIYVKDASKWDAKTAFGYIAFDTKPDYSDLPNNDLIAVPKGGFEQEGDLWKVTLKTPLSKEIAEGTNVRQHRAGAAYIYTAHKAGIPQGEWITLSGTTAGKASEFGTSRFKLWAGTASVRVLIMMQNGKPGNVVEMKNIKVEEVE